MSSANRSADGRPLRVQLYSHDSMGLGHVRRNAVLAHALAEHLPRLTGRPVTGMLLSGLDGPFVSLPTGFDLARLPGVSKAAGRYTPRRVNMPMPELSTLRAHTLTALITGFAPDLFIVDRHPLGVNQELRDALTRLRRDHPRTRIVLGLREVLDEPEVAAREWASLGDPQALRRLFDAIWVYGAAEVHDLVATGELPAELADLAHFTGYLAHGRERATPAGSDRLPDELDGSPFVLTVVGGGQDGQAVCDVAAQASAPPGLKHLIVTGPQMSDSGHEHVVATASDRTVVCRSLPDTLAAVREAKAVVAMAGYNTVAEILSTRTPALLVPRERPRLEQAIRAASLVEQGVVEECRQSTLGPEQLSAWFESAVGHTTDRSHLPLDGVTAVAEHAAQLVGEAPQLRPMGVNSVAV